MSRKEDLNKAWERAFDAYVAAFGDEPSVNMELGQEEATRQIETAVASGKPLAEWNLDEVVDGDDE
ncbi:MAG: hypothetical protein HN742_23715 [Lentisphaerae bacterium]|jgi:hypothetical protein|nr:hypothetical protein [Gemmatimonadota bacterium]MBT7844904.1 hypothetical protein [Lentisphaerota bacterium]